MVETIRSQDAGRYHYDYGARARIGHLQIQLAWVLFRGGSPDGSV